MLHRSMAAALRGKNYLPFPLPGCYNRGRFYECSGFVKRYRKVNLYGFRFCTKPYAVWRSAPRRDECSERGVYMHAVGAIKKE
jgi:hypothetical protein